MNQTMLQSAKQIGAGLARIGLAGVSSLPGLFRKSVFIRTIFLIVSAGTFCLDVFVLCEGSFDTPEGHKGSESYRPKPVYIFLILAGLIGSFILIQYGVTADVVDTVSNSELVVSNTDIQPFNAEAGESQGTSLKTVRDYLKLVGDSLDGKK